MKTFTSFLLAALFCACSAVAFGQAESTWSGSWYNPARDGEGFHIELLGNGQALVIWFTYPGSSNAPEAEQAWILGVGAYTDGKITIPDAYQATGPVFGSGYDKDDFQTTTWGEINVTFNGPDNAQVDFDGLDGKGTTQVTRLTNLIASDGPASLPPGISGAWYDPETNGQGWFVEILSATSALVYWFTYDHNGNPAWNLGVGTIYGNQIVLPDNLAGKGTRFGPDFRADDIDLLPFSMLILEFSDCISGNIQYLTAGGAEMGSFPLERLTYLDGYGCTALVDPRQDQTVTTNATDPLLSQYLGLDKTAVNLFGVKTGNGRAERLKSGFIQTPGGQTLNFELDGQGLLSFIQDSVSDITLTSEMDGDGGAQIVLNDPVNGVSAGTATETIEGVKKMKPGVPGVEAVTGGSKTEDNTDGGSAIIDIELCGEATDSAQVNFLVDDPASGSSASIVLPATRIATGRYLTALPTGLGSAVDDSIINDNCAVTAGQLGQLCQFVNAGEPGSGLVSSACLEMGQQMGIAEPGAATAAAATCAIFNAAFSSVCAANVLRADSCGPDADKVYRDFSSVQISAEARFPGLSAVAKSPGMPYDSAGSELVLPKLTATGKPYYKSHVVSPSIPNPGESYSIDLNLGCVSPGQTVTVNNLSNDTSSACTVTASGRCLAEVDSSAEETSNVLEISSPSGTLHKLVQKLAVDEVGQDGLWRIDFVESDGFHGLGAVGIVHPRAYFCDFSNNEGNYSGNFTWSEQRGYYLAPPDEDGDVLGIKIENGLFCGRYYYAGSPTDTEAECFSGVSKVTTWSQATAGDGGYCNDFP